MLSQAAQDWPCSIEAVLGSVYLFPILLSGAVEEKVDSDWLLAKNLAELQWAPVLAWVQDVLVWGLSSCSSLFTQKQLEGARGCLVGITDARPVLFLVPIFKTWIPRLNSAE